MAKRFTFPKLRKHNLMGEIAMITILLPPSVFDAYQESVEALNESEGFSGIRIGKLDSEDQTVYIPDFHDPLTRMVHSGMAHSFLPPRKYPHTNIVTIEIQPESYAIREISHIYFNGSDTF